MTCSHHLSSCYATLSAHCPHQRREALARREAGEILTDIARTYNVSHSTISRPAQSRRLPFRTPITKTKSYRASNTGLFRRDIPANAKH
jgi:hypothetical protein